MKQVVKTNPVAAKLPSNDLAAMMAEIARLKAENDKLVKAKTLTGGIKVSPKGAVSVYGLGRFPITLYSSQWETLFTKVEDIKLFIVNNMGQLKVKGEE